MNELSTLACNDAFICFLPLLLLDYTYELAHRGVWCFLLFPRLLCYGNLLCFALLYSSESEGNVFMSCLFVFEHFTVWYLRDMDLSIWTGLGRCIYEGITSTV